MELLLRANHYSGWEDATFSDDPDPTVLNVGRFGSEVLIDVALTYPLFDDRVRVTVGANNIFDNLPDRESNGILNDLGATRPLSSPFGFTGGEWFVRIAADIQ